MIDPLNTRSVLEILCDRCKNIISIHELVVVFHNLRKDVLW